jgi:hypothetical protein
VGGAYGALGQRHANPYRSCRHADAHRACWYAAADLLLRQYCGVATVAEADGVYRGHARKRRQQSNNEPEEEKRRSKARPSFYPCKM